MVKGGVLNSNQLEIAQPPEGEEKGFRWLDALACAVGYGCGVGMIPVLMGYLVKPMQSELHLPTAALSFGSAVVFFSSLMAPFAGRFIGRTGVLPCLLMGHLALSMGLAIATFAPPDAIWLLMAGLLVLGSAPLCYTAAYAAAISLLFRERQGLAFGVAFGGTSFVTIAAAPAITFAVDRMGWRAGVGVMAIIAVTGGIVALSRIALPLRRVFYHAKPAGCHESKIQNAAARPARARSALFWLLTAALAISLIPLGGFIGQLQPLLSHVGFKGEARVTIGIAYAVAIFAGRLGGGVSIDRSGGSVVVPCSVFVLAAFGALLMNWVTLENGIWLPLCAVLLLGAANGAEADFAAYYCLKAFGDEGYAANIGTILLFSGFGFALGGYAFALGYDLSGSYRLSATIASLLFVTAAAIFALIRQPLRVAYSRRLGDVAI